MEGNGCDVNHLDSDVLLPPRKRLLAGLKKQNLESTPWSPQGISNSSPLFGFDARINSLVKSCKNGSSMTLEEIAEAAGSAAAAAAKAAMAARAAAEEKSATAAKAVAAAKSALALVASFSEKAGMEERKHRKSKFKKHVPVQLLYKKNQRKENCRKDEELARKLHQAINSSPRISKHSPGSDMKNHKHKKLKVYPTQEKGVIPNGVVVKEGKIPSVHSKENVLGDVESESSDDESYTVKLNGKASKSSTADHYLEHNSRVAESRDSKEKHFEASAETYTNGRKRGRVKLKKLPLSLCSIKDQANPSSSGQATDAPDKPIPSSLPSPLPEADGVLSIGATPTLKIKDFKVPEPIEQNKVVQS
ncbi:hypothetical protein Droror1_Dr00022039 [Drosera rotundifolia]